MKQQVSISGVSSGGRSSKWRWASSASSGGSGVESGQWQRNVKQRTSGVDGKLVKGQGIRGEDRWLARTRASSQAQLSMHQRI